MARREDVYARVHSCAKDKDRALRSLFNRVHIVENIVSHYAYFALMGVVTLFVVPIYVRTLGPTQWGNIALCATLQGFLFAMDIGLSPIMMRNVARAAAAGNAYQVYFRFLRLYARLGLFAFAIGQEPCWYRRITLSCPAINSNRTSPGPSDRYRAVLVSVLEQRGYGVLVWIRAAEICQFEAYRFCFCQACDGTAISNAVAGLRRGVYGAIRVGQRS